MKNFFKKITGLDKVEAEKAQVQEEKLELLTQEGTLGECNRC